MSLPVYLPSGTVDCYFSSDVSQLASVGDTRKMILLTDSNVYKLHGEKLLPYELIVIPAGEEYKTMDTVKLVTDELIRLGADRSSILVGIGGGVVTDIAGFAASIYMRGIGFGFVPTTLLAMVDAAIGGKNGVNVGPYKNMLGVIRQPAFILFDTAFLATLPEAEWSNGFAEIIKYGCVFEPGLLETLGMSGPGFYRHHAEELEMVIAHCAGLKHNTIIEDEQEKGVRRLLNFGHTAGHAIETSLKLPHGAAVSIGMVVACKLSEWLTGLAPSFTDTLKERLRQFGLPVWAAYEVQRVLELMKMDKKKNADQIRFVLLRRQGEAVLEPVPMAMIDRALKEVLDEGDR